MFSRASPSPHLSLMNVRSPEPISTLKLCLPLDTVARQPIISRESTILITSVDGSDDDGRNDTDYKDTIEHKCEGSETIAPSWKLFTDIPCS